MFISLGSWSVRDGGGRIDRMVETVGVGDGARDDGSDEDLERGDEGVDEVMWGKLTAESFGG